MKYLVASSMILIAAVIAGIYCSKLQNKPESIPVSDLNQLPVIGKLGVPLGEVVTIQGTIVDGDSLQTERDYGRYLLRVTAVNGVNLVSQPIMEFSSDHGPIINLPVNQMGLLTLSKVEGMDEITGYEIKRLKAGYIGKIFSLLVYETGEFSGIPADLPENSDLGQDHGFCFQTHLEVLKEVK